MNIIEQIALLVMTVSAAFVLIVEVMYTRFGNMRYSQQFEVIGKYLTIILFTLIVTGIIYKEVSG